MADIPGSAMVMAAGLGKRMRPLTATCPKPLVRVAGKALIDHSLDQLDKAGVRQVVVNVHYLADAVEAHLENSGYALDFTISDEREQLLETGGGLVSAQELIESDPFYCVNSDTIWIDGPTNALHQLVHGWDEDRMDALLLVVPHARAHHHRGKGDFHMDGAGRLSWRKSGRIAPFIFTGIQLVSKRLLADPPSEEAFSTSLFWTRATEAGRLFGSRFDGEWFDIGSPAAIAPTEQWLSGGSG